MDENEEVEVEEEEEEERRGEENEEEEERAGWHAKAVQDSRASRWSLVDRVGKYNTTYPSPLPLNQHINKR